MAEERLKHTIIYQNSTSEIKDDVAQLIGCLVSAPDDGPPFQLPKQKGRPTQPCLRLVGVFASHCLPSVSLCHRTEVKPRCSRKGKSLIPHACMHAWPHDIVRNTSAAVGAALTLPLFALSQQPAAFLLWYHALEGGEDKLAELTGGNVINICLTVMDSRDASAVDKSCCAGGRLAPLLEDPRIISPPTSFVHVPHFGPQSASYDL